MLRTRFLTLTLTALLPLAAIAGCGGDDDGGSGNRGATTTQGEQPASGGGEQGAATEAERDEQWVESEAPADSGEGDVEPKAKVPFTAGDWRVDAIDVSETGLGDFAAKATMTFIGDEPHDGKHLFTLTVMKNDDDLGVLDGETTGVRKGKKIEVIFSSTMPFLPGPYEYLLQQDA